MPRERFDEDLMLLLVLLLLLFPRPAWERATCRFRRPLTGGSGGGGGGGVARFFLRRPGTWRGWWLVRGFAWVAVEAAVAGVPFVPAAG